MRVLAFKRDQFSNYLLQLSKWYLLSGDNYKFTQDGNIHELANPFLRHFFCITVNPRIKLLRDNTAFGASHNISSLEQDDM